MPEQFNQEADDQQHLSQNQQEDQENMQTNEQ